ncbi:DUF2730 domain-containing protein [Leisingera sp. M658]|uniref:DUF2730 domain-containing protein n=1 Tax=Leisingera sp. M658 TaxID=2867015 RepID=UPI0021A85E43|nr:DUF2730 domain-containing protein [Leisingera sp. M658]UWQ76815.1 DUF2730 domain-containing protein [Leisingera sp. M658]
MEFDPTFTFSNLLTTGSYAVALGCVIYTWFATRRSNVDARFKIGSDRMNDLDKRIQAAEQKLSTMPEKDDIHSLQLLLTEMGGELKAVRTSIRAIAESQTRLEHISSRHEDYLREKT